MRFHPELRYRDGATVHRFPALVAAVTGNADDPSGDAIVGVQRTWLDPRRPAKANVAAPRKALGRIYGHAVRFGIAPAAEGALAAERLARRCARAGVTAAVIVSRGSDFNDDLMELGASALAARLRPLLS